jgi:hypothetical protein
MIDAQSLALLDVLHAGHLAPNPSQPRYDELLAVWLQRYRVRVEAAQRLLDAVDAIEVDASTPTKPAVVSVTDQQPAASAGSPLPAAGS